MALIGQHILTEASNRLLTETTNLLLITETLTDDGTTAGINPPVPINRVYDPFQQRLMPQSRFWRPVAKYPLWRKH